MNIHSLHPDTYLYLSLRIPRATVFLAVPLLCPYMFVFIYLTFLDTDLSVSLFIRLSLQKPYVMDGSCEIWGQGSRYAPVDGRPHFTLISAGLHLFVCFCPSFSTFPTLSFHLISSSTVCLSDSSLALSHWLLESELHPLRVIMRSAQWVSNSSLRLRTPQ